MHDLMGCRINGMFSGSDGSFARIHVLALLIRVPPRCILRLIIGYFAISLSLSLSFAAAVVEEECRCEDLPTGERICDPVGCKLHQVCMYGLKLCSAVTGMLNQFTAIQVKEIMP